MALSKQRLVLVGVLGVAGGAYTVDRLFFGASAPQSAAAALVEEVTTAVSTIVEPGATAPTVSRTDASMTELAERLRALDIEASLTDLPESFRVWQAQATEDVAPESPAEPEMPGPVVTAILSGTKPAAVADGRTVRVGELVADWMVVDIAQDHVVFERDGRRVESRVR